MTFRIIFLNLKELKQALIEESNVFRSDHGFDMHMLSSQQYRERELKYVLKY